MIAEERDVFGVRAAHRDEDLWLYELRLDAPERRPAVLIPLRVTSVWRVGGARLAQNLQRATTHAPR